MRQDGNKRYKDMPRKAESKKKLTHRCNRIAGQIKAVADMIEDDRYCEDVLIQLTAINNSVKSLAIEILEEHMSTCMVEDIRSGKSEVVGGIIALIKRYRYQ